MGQAGRSVGWVTGLLGVALCLIVAVAIGCSKKNNDPRATNELANANSLIDQKRYSEAIYLLENRIKRAPKETLARVLLASAYAGRAGIELANYVSFGFELTRWHEVDDFLPESDDPSILYLVAKVALRFQIVVKAFELLPEVGSPEAWQDLKAAHKTLADAGHLEGGPALYRALLHVVILKKNLKTTYRAYFKPGCQISSRDLKTWLTATNNDIASITKDIAFGFSDPKVKEDALKFSVESRKYVDDLMELIVGAAPGDIVDAGPMKELDQACE